MGVISIRLFGKFQVVMDDRPWDGPEGSKAKELFCYLLCHPNSCLTREALAEILWSGFAPQQSKRNLRQTLWKLQSEFEAYTNLTKRRLVLVKAEQLYLNLELPFQIDVAAFEQAFELMQRNRCEFDEPTTQVIARAVHSFPSKPPPNQLVWRGQIVHVLSGEHAYFQEINGVTDFMIPYLEGLGIFRRKGWIWRWWRHLSQRRNLWLIH